MPNSRQLSISLNSDGSILTIVLTEMPNEKIAESFLSSLYTLGAKVSFFINMLETKLGKNFIEKRIAEVFSPTLIAVESSNANAPEIIKEENKRVAERISSLALVRKLANRFLDDEDAEEIPEGAPSIGGMILSSLVNRFFSKEEKTGQDDQ